MKILLYNLYVMGIIPKNRTVRDYINRQRTKRNEEDGKKLLSLMMINHFF